MVAAMGAVRVAHWIDSALAWETGLNPAAVQAVLGTMASSMFTFVVFVSSALLVAVQLASSQLTPRIIAIVFRDPVTKFCLVVFVFAFTFSLAVLVRVAADAPPLTAYIAAYSCLASLGAFLYLIDHMGKTLRPSGALGAVAHLAREVIESVYPHQVDATSIQTSRATDVLDGQPSLTLRSRRNGVVVAFDLPGLVSLV
jgi:uncharacterized membrane protein